MVDLLTDIEDLETALIYLAGDASDDKRAGFTILENMIEKKKSSFEKFENEMEKEMGSI